MCGGRPGTPHRVPDQKGGQTGELITTQVNVLLKRMSLHESHQPLHHGNNEQTMLPFIY